LRRALAPLPARGQRLTEVPNPQLFVARDARRRSVLAQRFLTVVAPQLLKDFEALGVNDAKPDRPGRPFGLARCIDGRTSVLCGDFDFLKRSERSEVATRNL